MGMVEILAGGWRLVRTQPKALAIWGVVYLALSGINLGTIWPMMPDLIAFQAAAAAAQLAQQPPPPPPAGFFGAIFGINFAMLLAMAAIFAAAVRAVARGGDDGFGFLRVGMDELRLIGLGVLLIVLGFVAMLALGIMVGIVVAVLTMLLGTGALLVLIPVYFGLIGVVFWAQVRISLAGALTVLRGRLVLVEAWRVTKGRFWTLFGAYFVLGFVYMVIGLTLMGLLNPDLLGMMAGNADPAAAQAAIAQQQAMLFGPRMIAVMLIGVVINAVGLAWAFGSVATAAIAFDQEDHGAAM